MSLVVASRDGTSPPASVNLLGLRVTKSDTNAHPSARTGDGLILGNPLFNPPNPGRERLTQMGDLGA